MVEAVLHNPNSVPLDEASYNSDTGILYLLFSYDDVLRNSNFSNARHIDAVVFEGTPYEIELHPDDGPRDANGRYIYNENTVENEFSIFVGRNIDVSDGFDLTLTDRANGTVPLYDFSLEAEEVAAPPPAPEPEPEPEPVPPTPEPEPVPPAPEPEPEPVTLSLYLFDVDTEEQLAEITDGISLEADMVEDRSLTIIAVPDNGSVGSVVFQLGDAEAQLESYAPYTLFGDMSNEMFGESFLAPGETIELSLTAYSERSAEGSVIAEQSFSVSVNEAEVEEPPEPPTPVPSPPIADPVEPEEPEPGFTLGLYDTETNELLTQVVYGDVIDIDILDGRNVTIAAEADGLDLGSVELTLGDLNRIENATPYALFGDTRGDYWESSLSFSAGETYELDLVGYNGKAGTGGVALEDTFVFTIDDIA